MDIGYNGFSRTEVMTQIGENFITLKAGDVVRLESANGSAFMDAVILGFDAKGNVKLARPYVYASSVGTTGPVSLVGTEVFTTNAKSVAQYDKVIDHGRIT